MVFIPPTPDIRTQRPEYFQKPMFEEGRVPAAFPQGFKPYDPRADRWDVPDQWPEIEAQLRGIIERGPGEYFVPSADQPLTPEQEAHNKMLMAWKSPQGLAAIETGKYREFQQKATEIERAQNRVNKLEQTLVKMGTSKETPPKQLMIALEKRYNKAIEQLEKLTDEDSGYPKYTEKGKLEIEGYEEPPGFFSRLLGGARDIGEAAIRGGAEIMGAEVPEAATPEEQMIEPGGSVFKALTDLTASIVNLFKDDAPEVINQINQQSRNPAERLDLAVSKVQEKDPNDPAIQNVKRMRTAQQAGAVPPAVTTPPVSPTPEQPGILERFQQALPSNQEYIEGGGFPGMAMRGAGRLLQPFLGTESPPQQVIGGVNNLEAQVRAKLLERERRMRERGR